MNEDTDEAICIWLEKVINGSGLNIKPIDDLQAYLKLCKGIPSIDLDEIGGEFTLDVIGIFGEFDEEIDISFILDEWWQELEDDEQEMINNEINDYLNVFLHKESE